MATEKKKNIFQTLLEGVKRGLDSPVARILPAVAGYQAIKTPGPVRNFVTATAREIVNQVKPLGISAGQTIAYNLPSTRRQIETSRNQMLDSQRKLIARAAVEKNPETKRRLLKLSQDIGTKAGSVIQDTTPSYTPREILTSGAKTAGLLIGGPKLLTKTGAFTGLISGVLSGVAEKFGGGSFTEGAARGVAYTPHVLAVTRATDPLIYKIIPTKSGIAPRVSAAAANVIQGRIIEGVSGRPVTPGGVALDVVAGAVGGRSTFRPVSSTAAKLKFNMDRKTFDELIEAEDILRNPDKFIDKVKTFATPDARETAIKKATSLAGETIDRLAARYLPDKVLNRVAGDPIKTVKALADLSQQNKLAQVPGMAFTSGTRSTRAKITDLQKKIAEAVGEGSAKAEIATATRQQFSDLAIKDFNIIKRLSRVGKYAEGDIQTYRANYPQLTERSIQAVTEARPDIQSDGDALNFILKLPTKAETKVPRPAEVGELAQLKKVAKIEDRGIKEGRRLEQEAIKRERQAIQQVKRAEVKAKAEEEVFNTELGESLGGEKVPTQKEYIENFRKEVGPMNLNEAQKSVKDTRRLANLINYNDTLRRMGYKSDDVKKIGFLEAERIIRENVPPKPSWDTLEPNVAKDLRETDKALGDVSKPQTPVEKKISILDLFRTPDRVLKKIGLEREARFLRHQYEKALDETNVEINRITEWSKRIDPNRKEEVFKYLDGQPSNLNIVELETAREIQRYLRDWAEKLKLPKDKQISHYITHIFERDFIKKEFDEDLAKLIADRQPGSVYDPFLQKRLGQLGYIEDPWRALDAYVKRAVRKYNMDPALEQLKVASEDLELSQAKYVRDYTERINMRPTEMDNLIDNFIKSTPLGYKFGGRPVATLTSAARRAVYRGTLGLNVGTAIKNLTQGANTYAKLGEKYTLLGYTKAVKDFVQRSGELEDVGVLRQQFIQDRQVTAVKKFWEKADQALFVFFEAAERLNRGAAYYGAKSRALDNGATEAVAQQAGKDLARDTQFTFGSVDTPSILQADIAKSLLQFQSFSIKQAEFLGEMIKNKEYAGLVRWLGANLALIALIGDAVGMEFKDIIPSVRVGGSPSISLGTGISQLFLGNQTEREKALDNIKKSLVAHIPAGTQLKKTFGGIDANIRGGVFSPGGQLKYPVGKDFGDQIFNVIFGPGRTKGASFYFDNELSPLGTNDTYLWQSAVAQGKDPYVAWGEIYKIRIAKGIDDKVRTIARDQNLDVEQKQIEAQKVVDEARTLIEKINQFASLGDIVPDLEPVPEIKVEEKAVPSAKKGTSKKLAYGVKLKRSKKPSIKRRVLTIKKSRSQAKIARLVPIKIALPAVKKSRRFKIA